MASKTASKMASNRKHAIPWPRVFVRLTVWSTLCIFLSWTAASANAGESILEPCSRETDRAALLIPYNSCSPKGEDEILPDGLIRFEDEEKDAGYQESKSRRFEIIFFISLPASALISMLGVMAFKSATGDMARFSQAEYGYIALSSIGISLSIAVRDSRKVYRKSPFE